MNSEEREITIKLAQFTFDPIIGISHVLNNLRFEGSLKTTSDVRIIQFNKPLTQEQQLQIKGNYGLSLTDYIPNYAYIELINCQMLERLSNDPLFRAEIPYLPAFKISPLLDRISSGKEQRIEKKELWLNVILFGSADVDRVVRILNDTGATDITVVDDRNIGGSLQIRFKIISDAEAYKIAELDEVRWLEEVPERKEDNIGAAGTLQSGFGGNQTIWNKGLHGEQQVIGIIDSGPLDINHCFFRQAVNNEPGTVHRKVLSIRNVSGTIAGAHATFVAGCAAGDDFNNSGTHDRRGGAWAAKLVSGNYNDLDSSSMLAELVAAADTNARIHTNSWHDNTAGPGNPAIYNQTAAEVDTFTWNNEDNLVLGSAGNRGEEQGPPGTAKNAICVAASRANPNEMNFGDGSNGPTADGRLKPDLMAPGCNIQSASVFTPCKIGY